MNKKDLVAICVHLFRLRRHYIITIPYKDIIDVSISIIYYIFKRNFWMEILSFAHLLCLWVFYCVKKITYDYLQNQNSSAKRLKAFIK